MTHPSPAPARILTALLFALIALYIALTFGQHGISNDEEWQHVYGRLLLDYYGSGLTDLSAFQKTVDVNIRGYFFMSAAGAKLMAKHGGGAIVNVASVNGVIPGMYQGIYSITKAAVISMTQCFAKECAGMGVRVNALLPGFTDTKFASALVKNPVIVEKVLEHVPMRRIAEPEEMAGSVLYLVSPAGSYTTGVALNVDGGYLIG